MATCLAALDGLDAGDQAYFVNEDWVPTSEIVAIYRRRASHIEDIGLPTLRFREAVQRMAATSPTNVRLAGVEGEGGYPTCVVLLAPDEPDVIAVLAVRDPPRRPDPGLPDLGTTASITADGCDGPGPSTKMGA